MRLGVLLAFFWVLPASALVTAYVTFDHPDGWRCELSQGVWICQSTVETDRKESVILSIATIATEWDTLDNYLDYLSKPRNIQDEDGSPITAKVSYARKRNINGITWIDSLQHNSELPGFWARYLATVHQTGQTKLAILITYIVSEDRYNQFSPQFERMVSSLKPNAEFDMKILSQQGDGPLPGSVKLGPLQKGILDGRLSKRPKEEKKPVTPTTEAPINPMIYVGVGAVVFLLLIRRSRKKKPSSSAPRGGTGPGPGPTLGPSTGGPLPPAQRPQTPSKRRTGLP